jgi:hypothetical protein
VVTFRIAVDVKDDRRVILTLPAEVPTGQAELVVTVKSPAPKPKPPRTSLADPEASAWLAEVRDFQQQVLAERGCFPDSTSAIAADRVRDESDGL